MGLGGLSSRAKGHSSGRQNPSTPLSNPDPFPRRGQDTRGVQRILSNLEEGAPPQKFNPSHSLSCGPTMCLRAEGQVLLPVCFHSPGGSPPTPQTSRGLPYPQRALVSRPSSRLFTGLRVPGVLRPPLSPPGSSGPAAWGWECVHLGGAASLGGAPRPRRLAARRVLAAEPGEERPRLS